jgi:hypothetical protein
MWAVESGAGYLPGIKWVRITHRIFLEILKKGCGKEDLDVENKIVLTGKVTRLIWF